MSVYKNISIYNYPFSPLPPLSPHCLLLPTATQQDTQLIYTNDLYVQLPFLSSTTTTIPHSHSANCSSINTPNVSLHINLYIKLHFLSSTATTSPQSHSAIWFSTNTPNLSLHKDFYIQLPFLFFTATTTP